MSSEAHWGNKTYPKTEFLYEIMAVSLLRTTRNQVFQRLERANFDIVWWFWDRL